MLTEIPWPWAWHWLRPAYLILVLPLGLLWFFLWRLGSDQARWQSWIDPGLLPHLLTQGRGRSEVWLALLGVSWLAAILVLAGPVWSKAPSAVQTAEAGRVLVWDLSPSMLASDVKPSRLERARLKIIDLLKALPEGQVALIVYAGDAHTVTPLTDDRNTLINLLPALHPSQMPLPGSNPEAALLQAQALLEQAQIQAGQIVLITDEIATEALPQLTRWLADSPHQLTLWTLGSTEGAPIPWGRGGFVKDSRGQPVLARLNEAELMQFARESGSHYVPLNSDNRDIDTLTELLSLAKTDTRARDGQFDQWDEKGHWLLWLLLPVAALAFRRGVMTCFVLGLVLVPGVSVNNAEASLFKTPDQQGASAYAEQHYDNAAQAFADPGWRGAALYRAGRYAEAEAAFTTQGGAEGLFNAGNSALAQGKAGQALAHFAKAKALNPSLPGLDQNQRLAEALKKAEEERKQQENQHSQSEDKPSDEASGDAGQNGSGEPKPGKDSESSAPSQSKDANQSDQSGESQNAGEPGAGSSSTAGAQGEAGTNSSQGSAHNEAADSQGQADDESDADQPQQNPAQGTGSASSTSSMPAFFSGASEPSSNNEESGDQPAQTNPSSEGSGEHSDEKTRELAQPTPALDAKARERTERLDSLLRRVPDDPAGLLRNKFKRQAQERQQSLGRGGLYEQQATDRW
jgi:Ca-activated chloride channel homolog